MERSQGKQTIELRLRLLEERVQVLQTQWKWVVGVLTTLAAALSQGFLKK